MRRSACRLPVVVLLLIQFTLWSLQVQGANGVWTLNNNGNWTTSANWSGGTVPGGAGDVAIFNQLDINGNRTVTLDAPVTLGGLLVNDSLGGNNYIFAGSNALTFDNGLSDAFLRKFGSATDVIQTPLVLTSNLNFGIHTGTLQVNGASNAQVAITGAGNLIKSGAGTLQLNSNLSGFAGNYVLNLGTLAIGGANGATVDLGTGTGGIILNGSGSADRTVLQLRNNGVGSNGLVTYTGNNDVTVQGAATINVDRDFLVTSTNTGNTIVLDNLTMNGGLLQTTGGNSYALQFDGTTTLAGQTNVFFPNTAQLRLAGVITDGAASRALIKEGPGRLLVMNSGNAYDGVTAVKNGILQLTDGAKLGSAATFVNGGILSVATPATLAGVSANGLNLVGQLGTSRFVLPVVAVPQSFGNIDGANPLAVNVPVAGMMLGIDGTVTNNIQLSQVGGGTNRVWLSNLTGLDTTFQGVLQADDDGMLRLASPGNTLIISGAADRIGGDMSFAPVTFGYDLANPINYAGAAITQVTGGTVSVRVNNPSLSNVTINRGVTVNINGTGLTAPLGQSSVTMLGGTLTTDNTTDAKFGNTSFSLYGGSTFLLDNSAVTGTNVDRRLDASTNLSLSSSIFRLLGDGGAATVSSQTLVSLNYSGGSTLSIDTDAAIAGRLTTLTVGSLNRVAGGAGTLNLRNIGGQATTFGTATGTQKLIVSGTAPTVTNGMIGANIALWGGTAANDGSTPLFVTYDATHGVQAAATTTIATAANLASATASTIASINGVAIATSGNATVQALNIRSTVNTQTLTGNTITIGSTAGADQGAGLFLAHTAGNGITHSSNFTFGGTQEGFIYASTAAGNASSVITLSGVIAGSNGLTRFGDGILSLTGANTFAGPLNLNAGETRLSQNAAGLAAAALASGLTAKDVNLYGGSVYLQSGSARYNTNITAYDNARLGNVNVAAAGFNNLTIAPRADSSAPVVLWVQNQAGTNQTTAYGSLNLNGPAQFNIAHILQVNGGLTGSASLERFGNERLILAGDSGSFTGPLTAYAGSLVSFNGQASAKPFGTGNVTLNPGSAIVLAAPTNLNAGQLKLNSDFGGLSGISQLYVGAPGALPAFTGTSNAPWRGFYGIGAVGYDINIDQAALATAWGGRVSLGAPLGYTGIYTGELSPAAGGQFLFAGGQGGLRIARPLTGNNSVVAGISMTGDASRADQVLNNASVTLQFDVPMTYTGNTVLNPSALLRVSAKNALTGTGDLILSGGQLRVDSSSGQNRMLAPISINNNVVMTADSLIQMENSNYDMRLGGSISLAPGSTGVVRTLSIGTDQAGADRNNAGMVYLDGGISDGSGGSGNHFVKSGPGTLFFNGTNTYTGSTTITGGLIGVNQDADWGATSLINLVTGGIAVWENSFTTARNYHVHGGNGYFDIAGGLTLTQDAASVIDGGNFLIKRGLGTLVLNGTNAVTGLFVADGVLQINSQASFGNPAETGNDRIQFGGDQTIGGANNGTRYTGGTLRVHGPGATLTTARGLQFNNNGNTNFSGGVDVTANTTFQVNGVISQGTEFDYGFKTGPGTLITTNTNTWRQFAMTDGTLQFSNNVGGWANSTATAADNTIVEMLGGTIRAANTGANIAMTNLASTTTYNYGGGMHLRLASGAGFSAELAADNLLRVNQGTLVIETEGATLLGGAGATNAARVVVTNAINAGLARASALNNGIFAPHLLGADAAGTAYFLTNDATTGFKAYTGAVNTSLAGAAPTAIADITAPQALSGANSIYAFRTSADLSGGTLNLTAVDNRVMGGVVINGSNTIGTHLVFDPASETAPGTGTPGEGLVYVKTGENAVLAGNVTSNAFTKYGRGTLTIGGSASVLGELSVQDGTLKAGSAQAFSRLNSELNINAGATFDLNGYHAGFETIGANNRQVATANVGGTITNSSATTAALMMAGPVSSFYNGVLGLNTRLVKAGSGVLTLNGFSASTPDSGNNTYTGGTDIYGTTAPTITGVATTVNTATLTVANTAGLAPGMMVSGSGIPANTYVTGIVNATTFTISQNATATATGVTLTSFGGLTLNNANFGFGGYNGSAAGDVNLYSGNLNLLFSNGTTGINGTHGQNYNNQVLRIGADGTDGVTLNVRGPGTIYVNQGLVSSSGLFGLGNIVQVGALNMTNTTLTVGGGNLYRFRAAGPISILGSQAAFQTSLSDGPSGAIELFGPISGTGALTKLGNGILRGIVIANPGNTYSGGTNIVAGDVQVLATSGTPLGSGPIRVFPDGTLRLAANTSIDGSKLTVMSRVNSMGAVALDDNFNPTLLNSGNFSSVYNTTIQLAQPYFNATLDLAAIGDGRAFLGGALNAEAKYLAPTLGAGMADAWNPGVGVYRLVGGSSSLALEGVNNVLTGNSYLQVGPQRNNVLGAVGNSGNGVVIRNSNNFSGGTQITKGTYIYFETGGRVTGETPLGTGAVEVYGELRARGAQGSFFNAATGLHNNLVNLRPGGVIRLHDADGAVAIPFVGAGNQGRWGDSVGIDLNGGIFIYQGPANMQGAETIGNVTARKAGQLQVFRNTTASSAQLNVGDISRAERGVLNLVYNSGFLGTNTTAPLSFERITATGIGGSPITLTGTTANGPGVTAGGMVVPWIIDRTTHSFVGYDPTVAGTGFQPLVSAAPSTGQIGYNKIASGALTAGGLVSGDIADLTTAAKTLADNPTLHALRTSQNISPTLANTTMTLTSGGLIMTAGTINPTGAVTAGVVSPMTLNFGLAGAGEAIIYNSGTAVIQAQINAAQGLTKFGAGQLQIHAINPGIGGDVVLHEGTTYVRVPYSTSGSPVGQVLNSQDVIVNGGALSLQPFNVNAAGTVSEIASNVASAQSNFDSDIFIRGDASLRNQSAAQYVRIADLTVGNSAGSSAMNGNSTITLELQSGLWVRGTTTLAPEARINGTFNGFSQSTLAGVVTGAGGLIKFGNGATTLLNPNNNYAAGTTIWGSTNATAVSTVASAYRGAGTPFGTGDIQIQPGGMLRVADNANIASNAVYLRSDAYGLGGFALAHNGVLPTIITAGTPAAGQIKVESTGPFAGVIGLDYGYYGKSLNVASIPGGDWWIGNSQQSEAYYFNSTLGAAAGGKYLLGGGGNQSGVTFGSLLVNGSRTTLFENLFTGGTAGQVRMEIGAQTGDFAWNSPSFVNGNSGFIALTTRNLGLVGDVRVNTNTVLALGNSFGLGNGRLIVNGGNIRTDFGNNNFASGVVTISNDVILQGDYNAVTGGDFVMRGNLALSDVVGAGATRNLNINVGSTAVRGIVSGAAGSNLIKLGAGSLILSGANTYEGYTQVSAGTLVFSGDVLPGQSGPLGNSNSPLMMAGGSLSAAGRQVIGRDILVTASGTLDTRVHNRVLVLGGVSIAAGSTLTVGSAAADVAGFRGGVLQFGSSISGAGALTVGTNAAAPAVGGTVFFAGNSNGYGINTYSGGTTIQSARVQLGGSTYFSGSAANPTAILSGPLGTGTITFGSATQFGESNRGAIFEAVGGPVTIVNALAAMNSAANTTFSLGGQEALTFTRGLDLNSDASLRTRTFAVQNLYQPLTFSGALSASGAAGVSLIKTGPGKLVLTGTNTFATSATTGIQISQGILQINADAALGGGTSVRLNGGYLAVTESFATARQVILQAASGIDVASGKTLTLTGATSGAFALTKAGAGTLVLNSTANTITALTIGGVAQLNSGMGFSSATGGIVATTATSGTPFVAASGTVTLNSGALALQGGAVAQALSIGTLNFGAAGAVALSQGATSSQLTVASAFTRGGAFNSVNYGTLYVVPSALGNLGGTEKLLSTPGATGALANTSTGGGNILTTPAVFARLQTPGDANFVRYDAAGGLVVHNVTTVSTLAATASANVADISAADVAGSGNIDVQALRTSASITPADGTTLIRLARGGLILNGSTAPVISAPLLFGTATGASLTEAITYVREGQTGTSALTGGVAARDFTKTGPGSLEIGGTGNLLNSNALRLPVVSVQDGSLRFANAGAAFQGQWRDAATRAALGDFALNVNEAGIFDLNGLNLTVGALVGNGTVTSNVAGAANLVIRNGFAVDTTFNGSITDGAGVVSITKMQNGVMTLSGHNTFSGGLTVQGGRVTNATGSTSSLGRVEAQTVTALGTGGVTLQGGTLRLNGATLLGGSQTLSEVVNGIDHLLWGGPSGLNITVDSAGYSNGVALGANMTSTLNAATVNAGINNLTVNAPMLTFTEGLYHVLGTAAFSQTNTVLRTAGGRVFIAGKIDAAGRTITKTGANDLVLTNSASGADRNEVGLWKVYGGLVEARMSNGASNPLGTNPWVELNVGTTADARGLRLFTDGDGTGLGERVLTYADTNVRFGSALPLSSSEFVSSSASRLQVDRAFIANNSWKTVQINNVEAMGALGTPYVYFVLGNNDSLWVNGTTTFQRDLTLQIDGGQGVTLNGLVSGNGTFNRRSNGGSLYINADNTNGWNGGTFLVGGGRNYFGSIEGSQITLSNTAKLGKGHVFQGPNAFFQINDAGNLQADQNIYVAGNLSWMTNFSLAANLPLEQVRLRSLGLGGIQNSPTDYYLSASNPSSTVLSLGTVYTHALDMRAIGDGMWYLGSSTNGVGANGAYDAATLAPGLGNTYRLGAGGNTLFFGTNGNANVLTNADATAPSSLVIGAPMTVQNMAPVSSGTGTVVLLQNQNYTGGTLVNTQSVLDFRGTMTTSDFKVYGTLNVAGEAGSFINPVTGTNIPVALRPGSLLRFDNTSAGVLPTSATQGRWADTSPLSLNNSVIRLQGNTAVEVVETVGDITANNGGNRLEVVRGVVGRGTELRTPSIARNGFGTLQFIHNGSQLGSDERVIVTGTAPTVTNGMVAPWMVSASDQQFVSYNADVGFTIAGFDRVQGTATLTSLVDASNSRLLVNGVQTLNGGDLRAYALRLETDANLTTASAATNTLNRLIIDSGGLIAQSSSTRTIQTGLWAGASGTGELIVYNAGTLNVGIAANNTTSGRIKASGITKMGGGTLQILSEQPDFSGDIRLQQGALQFGYTGTSATSISSLMGGDGGNIVFDGNNTSLILRIGNDTFTGLTYGFKNNLVLGDYVSVATVNSDRNGGSITGKTMVFNNLTFGQSEGDVGQVLRVLGANGFRFQVDGTTTLNGRSAIAVDNSYNGTATDAYLMGKVTGAGTLVKGPSDSRTRTLFLQNAVTLNDYNGGTVLQGGTLQVLARSNNVAGNASSNLVTGGLGSGNITLVGGTLDLRLEAAASGAPDADIEFVRYTGGAGNGPDLTLNGSATLNFDRNSYTGTYTHSGTTVTATLPGGHNFVVGQSIAVSTGPAATANITAVTPTSITYTAASTATPTFGYFTTAAGAGSSKMLTFNNLTMASQTLTLSAGNSYGMAVAGTTTFQGSPLINNGAELVLGGGAGASGTANSIRTDGGQVIISKIGTSTLWVHSANNNLNAPIYINAGALDFGNRSVANNSANLGTGDIFINPGAEIRVRNIANINHALGQQVRLTGTPYSPAVLRAFASFTQAEYESIIETTTATSNQNSIIVFNGVTVNQNLDQSRIGNGRVFFGTADADRTYAGAGNGFIVPGLANLPNSVVGGDSANRVYRLGGRNSAALLVDLAGTGNLNDVGGPTDLQIGSLATFGPSGNFGLGQVLLQDQNTYTGQTVIARGSTLRFNSVANAANNAGPLGDPSVGGATVYVNGTLQVEGNGSFRKNDGSANAYNDIRLRPGGSLILLNNNATTLSNRWDDATGVDLDGARFTLDAANNVDLSAETIGAVRFDRGARIQTVNEGTSEILLTAASITRASASLGAGSGRGTMVFTPAVSGNLGLPSTTNNAEQVRFTAAPTTSATAAVSGMLPGYYMDGTAHRFVSYGANGVTPVPDGSMVSFSAGMTAGTAVVNMTATGNLPDFNPAIYALRVAGNINVNSPTGANNDATITFGGSGSDVGAVINTFINTTSSSSIYPNLKFGANGENEALFYTGANMFVHGNLNAGSVTKFGTALLYIQNDQSDAARGAGNGYSSGWVVNEGGLVLQQFGSAGNAAAGNTIVLNGGQASSGVLYLRAQPADSLLNYTYSSGRIIAVDNATIDWDPGADDRVHTIADIEIQQSGGIGNGPSNSALDAQLRVANNRSRSILAAGQLIVTNNGILNVDATATGSPFSAYSGNAAYLTNGLSSGMSVASLSGSERLTKWGDGYLYVRGASPDFSGALVIDQGAVHVTHNQSLGSGAVVVNRYGVLDIGVANFNPSNASLTYNEGSVERWSVDSARSGAVNLGAATLQIAANQPTTSAAITLNGGGIEAWLRNDDHIAANSSGGVLRVLNPNITFNLAGDSFVGARYYLGANGLDMGRQAHDNRPLEEYLASGAILEVQGVISGPGGLTKAGYDTVILSGANTYAGSTFIEGGRLLIGRDNALPVTTNLSTTSNAVLDLNGQNQMIGGLGNPVQTVTASLTGGFITNSGTAVKSLTVGNGVTDAFAYSGVIQHNVALVKTGEAVMTLNNVNTYLGNTLVNGGSLRLGLAGSIDDSPWLQIAGSAILDVSAKTSGYIFDGIVSGGGVDAVGTSYGDVVNAARIAGNLTIGDHIGEVPRIGTLAPGGSSVVGDITTAGNQIGHLYTSSNLTLNGQLAGSSPVVPVTRLTLQLGGSTTTLAALGYVTGSTETFLDALSAGTAAFNGTGGDLSGHDYLNVGGTLTLNQYGRVAVTTAGSYSPVFGDVFNLLDWTTLSSGTFAVGDRYQTGAELNNDLDLPSLSAGLVWDTSRFLSQGVIVVVPEPSRMLLAFLGLMALFFRRRRP